MKKIIKGAGMISTLLALVAGLGCTKETPYKHQYKEEVLPKSVIDTNSEYIYVASYLASSRSSPDAMPYFMGQPETVKFRFSKTALDVVAYDVDERFQSNETNNKPIVMFPVEHKAFRCTEDRFGECTNREEENREVTELERPYFKPDFSKIRDITPASLPSDMRRYFNGCYEEKDKRTIGFDITDDAVNIQIETTYRVAAKCVRWAEFESLSDTIFSVVYQHSFVKLSSVASPDYQPRLYPATDSSTFGFFTTGENRRDVDFRKVEKNLVIHMKRWNPNRQDIVYYLADEFNKPENQALKTATIVGFEKLNRGLAQAGAKFRLILKDPAGISPGDIRHSMIVLVEHPGGAGALGYGPSAANPRTGEIFSARTVMYTGILRLYVHRTYEQIREKKLAEKLAGSAKQSEQKQKPAVQPATPQQQRLEQERIQAHGFRSAQALANAHRYDQSHAGHAHSNIASSPLAGTAGDVHTQLYNYTARIDDASAWNAKIDPNQSSELSDVERMMTHHMGRLDTMSRHCQYPAELFNFEGILLAGIDSLFGDDMKPWAQLTDDEKTRVIDSLLPQVYVPILIHEVGHNLGLRHNFAGSEDKANWYAPGEVAGLDRKVPFSSVMDYGFNDSNALPTLGKYDVAALRFAYADKVETKTGELIPVQATLAEMRQTKGNLDELRSFRYCSDEHVGANSGCNRFDEGTNMTEIAQHWIRQYNDMYKWRNFRNEAVSFSLFNDPEAIAGRFASFFNLRLMYETYERIKLNFNLPDTAPEWQSESGLKDIREAARLSGEFFVDVMTTPDVLCRLEDRTQGTPKVVVAPIGKIQPGAISCFDIRLNPGYTMTGEAGRSFQSKKSLNSTNAYADQVDVRGIWIDKLVAAELLLMREVGSITFDRFTQSYIEMPEVRGKLGSALEQIFLDNVTATLEFRNADNQVVVKGPVNYKLTETHLIPQPLNPRAAAMLDLPGAATPFANQLGRILERAVPSPLYRESADNFMSGFLVYRMSSIDTPPAGLEERGGLMVEIGDVRYIALKENRVARAMIGAYQVIAVISRIDKALLPELATFLSNPQATEPPESLPDTAKALFLQAKALKVPPAALRAAATDNLGSLETVMKALEGLPSRPVR